MSENGVMDRPRRSTRSSLASSGGSTPVAPTSSNNPYKKPTYFSGGRGSGGDTPVSSRNTNGTSTPTSSRGRRGRGRPPGRNSFSGGRGSSHSHQHFKPECIAVRVDGRRSTGGSTASSGGGRRGAVSGGRRSTYNSRQDYEYHYGSDFESDQNDSEPEDEELESEQNSEAESISVDEDNDNAESDSDYSVKSTQRGSSNRLPSPPVPIWLDSEKVPQLPQLEVPNSSDDLLLPRELVVKAVEIYEPLRRFHQLVRLSPFRFEDFCGALACDDQSSLLAEIHIQLLRSVIREEDANGTLFGPNEVKDSVQAMVYFIDYITWPETLRSYLESDRSWQEVYDQLVSVEYPFCGPEVRIKVLGWLVDQFLTTIAVREQLVGDGKISHEDHCRACNRLGELICCETCPAVYHLECITPPLKDIDNPPDDWKCAVCMKHQVPGVNDCCSEQEKAGSLIRHERLGYDRHGRKYWFLVRRLLVESDDGSEVWYYSTRGQIEELLTRLDSENYESTLVSNIKDIEDELYRQMEVTEEVTRLQNTHRRKTYLEVESGKEENSEGGAERMTRLKSTGLYKLGQEGIFRSYVNHFTSDPTALSRGKHNEERDRKRHMSHKFSLTPASECKYGIKDLGGCPRATQISALKGALSHMETVLPTTLMHVNWPVLRKSWITSVQNGASALDFSRAMLMISACIRNAVYNPVWAENAGHVRLIRTSLLEREERKKAEKRDKKDKDEEEERLKAIPQFIKYKLPIRHQVYKQKGEEYRLHGRWGWIWLSNMRQCKPQDCRKMGLLAGPHKHVIQVKNDSGKVKTMLIDPGVYNKLMAKRNLTVATNSGSSSNPSSQTSGTCSNVSSSEATTTGPCATPGPSSSPLKTPDANGEAEDKPEKMDTDVEVKVQPKVDEEENEKEGPAEDIVKVEDESKTEGEVDKSEKDKKCDDKEGEEEEKESENESETPKMIEPKPEPMEVEEVVDNTQVESESQDQITTTGKEEDAGKKPTEEKESTGSEEEVKVVEEKTPSPIQTPMETDDNDKDAEQDKGDADIPSEENKREVELNGTEASSSEEVDKEKVPEVEKKVEVAEPVPPTTTTQSSLDSEVASSSSSAPVNSSSPGVPVPSVPMTPEKQEDPQARKFKTEIISVSSGLASAHRLLYPKVARRCEYLDSLLHRRLTLMSLEDKQLRSTYGDDMVNKAKTGISQFLEEEKKRKQEEDEYPTEEVIDPRLTLGGAYAFGCYSSECRKEALAFMKGKGKNRERIYEKICYSPMCRLKFCLQATTRIKQERIREVEKEKVFKVYKEIEDKRVFTLEGTSRKLYMKKLPDCLTFTQVSSTATSSSTTSNSTAVTPATPQKKKKSLPVKFPQVSSFQYATTKDPSILVLPQFELKKLARTAGRQFTPAGFFQNLKSGGWGWSYPCGRPVFRTAWQYRTTHANTLAAAAMQLKILYASIKWDDIVAKIPNTEGKHQVHTDTEIITTEILNHRIVGRFMERVQYLRRMMVVPIDAPKTIREITPSRIGLRKRKRAESPDKTEPVVTEDWVDEERLELWEIRYYGDRIDRKHLAKIDHGSNTPSTRTKSGIAIKQPEKYDPSHTATEKKTYPGASGAHQQNQSFGSPSTTTTANANAVAIPGQNSYDKTIEQVVRNQEPTKVQDGGKGAVSAVKTAERMRETIETEMKMQRAVHLSKRDSHSKNNGNSRNGTPQPLAAAQPTASQQFQQQMQQQQNIGKGMANGGKNIAQVAVAAGAGGKSGVVQKKFFTNRQNNATALTPTTSGDAALLTKRPYQNTITINKGAIAMMRNSTGQVQGQTQQGQQQQTQAAISGGNQAGQQVMVTTVASPATVSTALNTFSTAMTTMPQIQQQPPPPPGPQKLSVTRLPDGRLQVKGLLPGQQCYQGPDGKIHVTVSAAQMQQLAASKMYVPTAGTEQQQAAIVSIGNVQQQAAVSAVTASQAGPLSIPTGIPTTTPTSVPVVTSTTPAVNAIMNSGVQSQVEVRTTPDQTQTQAQVVPSTPVINISSQNVKTNIQTPITSAKIQQQFPQQIIVQQQNGQHLIIQGAAAQAILQQQQQKLLQQHRIVVQAPGTNTQQVLKQLTATTQALAGNNKSSVIVASSASVPPTESPVTGSRIVIQDGKAMVVTGDAQQGEQKGHQPAQVKQAVQTTIQQQQQQIVKPTVSQSSTQMQILPSQSGQIQLITHTQAQQMTSAGSSVTTTPVQSKLITNTAVVASPSTTATTTPQATVASSAIKVNTVSQPASSVTTMTTTSVPTTLKQIQYDGRTILLTQNQLNELQLAGGGRKILVNNKIIQLPASTSGALRGQPQILQTLASPNQHQVQIVQGPGGQQYLIQQSPTVSNVNVTAQQAQQVLQQNQQQQVQIVMPSGGPLGGGQPVIVKKVLKAGGVPTAVSIAGSPGAGAATQIITKSGNVLQLGNTVQSQLSSLIGDNKAILRLPNNQFAAIQLPLQQGGQVTAVTVSSPSVLSKTSTSSVTQQATAVSLPQAPTSTSTPTSAPQQIQQQTTITRTPGLPISIVSPSKLKAQQGQGLKQSGTVQVVSSNTPTPTPSSSISSVPAVSTTPPVSTTSPATPQVSKQSTVIRLGTPPILRGSSSPITILRSQSPSVASASATTPKPVVTPTVPSLTSPKPVILAQKTVTGTPSPLQTMSSTVGVTKPISQIINNVSASAQASAPAPVRPSTPEAKPASVSTISAISTPKNSEAVQAEVKPTTPVPDSTTTTASVAASSSQAPEIMSPPPPSASPLKSDSPLTSAASSVPGSPASVASSGSKGKTPSKIVAQIFQTSQGPKVVIQGVNPGELTQNQLAQLQAQIQKQLAAQHHSSTSSTTSSTTSSPISTPTGSGRKLGDILSPPTDTLSSVESPSVLDQISSPNSTMNQSPSPATTPNIQNRMHVSPVESLRVEPTTPTHVSHTQAPSLITSPLFSRSPPIPTMISPAKVLSPPANLPNMLSKSSSSGFGSIALNNNSNISAPPPPQPSPTTSVIVARKSQPRKSPIRPNDIDIDAHMTLFAPSPPSSGGNMMSPTPIHNNWNSTGGGGGVGGKDVTSELMRPLTPEQHQILQERKNSLMEEIMEKKKQAATQMRLEAQREIQEKMMEKNRALELAKVGAEVPHPSPDSVSSEGFGARGAKKRKMENNVDVASANRSSEGTGGGSTHTHTHVAHHNTHRRGPRGRGGGRKRKLFCICKTPYDKDRFYVGCDKCQNWFHGDCIGITEEMSRDLPEYICDDCKDDKLYCFCKKPYNESQFYIQCDKCDDWFHGRCVGVLQGESDTIGDYSCPTCEPDSEINFPNSKKLDTTDYMAINRLLKELLQNRASIPFRKPVSKSQAPNYFTIIKEPMDLQTISNRVEDRQYEHLRDFVGDVGKIFENCRYYNDASSDTYRHADNLEKFFVQKICALRESFNNRLH